MPMESLLQRSSVTMQDAYLCSAQQPGDLTDAFRLLLIKCLRLVLAKLVSFVVKAERARILIVSSASHAVFPPTRYVLLSSLETNQPRNFRGSLLRVTAPWLHDFLHGAGLRFYCQVCQVTSQATATLSSTHTAPPTEPCSMQSSINCIESKIDLLIAGLLKKPFIPTPETVVNHDSRKILNIVKSSADAAKSNTSSKRVISTALSSPPIQPVSYFNFIVNKTVSNAFRHKAIFKKS